jgi:hypothetical protein
LPGALAPEIIALAKEKGYEFTDEDPQKNYPDQLDEYRKEMTEKSWDFGQDDEELFELAMHDRQYRDYKSGIAKKRFEDDLQRAKDAALAKQGFRRRSETDETCQSRTGDGNGERADHLGDRCGIAFYAARSGT